MKKHLQAFLGLYAVWACITLTGCTFPGYVPPGLPASDGADSMQVITATLAPGAVVEVGEHAPESPVEGGGICDRAAPGHPVDVTVADEAIFQPGEEFTKTWRLVNVGDCVWSEDYAIIWFSGEPLGSSRILYLDVPVQPGESVDLSIEMTAPQQNGLYQSNWKMRNAEGTLFGLGPQGDAPFWARITVFDGSTPTVVTAPTHTPIPMIYQQGEVEVADAVPLDVDSGDVGMGDDDDISLAFKAGQMTVIPLGEVKLGLPDIKTGFPPAQSECIQTPLSADAIILEDFAEDVYICYQSSQGLPGYLWLKSVEDAAEQPGATFVTWFIP
jgi:Ig-like domain from next to BRCA1 gene